MLIGDIITTNAQCYPEKVGFIDANGRYTWDEINSRVNRLSHALLSLGLTKGERVAILCDNRHEFGEFLFAIAKTGLIGVGINYRLVPDQMARQINDCQPMALIVQKDHALKVNAALHEIKGVKVLIGIDEGHGYSYDYESLLAECPTSEPRVELTEDDIYMICYTSGTTGWVKGAIRTHRNRMAAIPQDWLVCRCYLNDILLNPGPVFAAGGQYRFFTACFTGSTHIFQTWQTAEQWAQIIEKEKVTVATMVPVRYAMIREYLTTVSHKPDLSSLRLVATVAHFTAEQIIEMPSVFENPDLLISKGYSGTELGMPVGILPEEVAVMLRPGASEKQKERLSAMGKAILCRIRVVNEEGKDVALGEVGELLLQGDSLAKGYWQRPELDAEVFKEGWYHTRDLVTRDEEDYLYFMGRKDLMIKTGGFNVFPEEVESVISNHPSVAEVAVFGVDDDKWQQAITAAVSIKTGHSVTEDEIKEYCRQYLSGFQVPKKVYFLEKLPTTETQIKVARMELRRMFGKSKD